MTMTMTMESVRREMENAETATCPDYMRKAIRSLAAQLLDTMERLHEMKEASRRMGAFGNAGLSPSYVFALSDLESNPLREPDTAHGGSVQSTKE